MQKNFTLLIIEDNKDDVRIIRDVLKNENYSPDYSLAMNASGLQDILDEKNWDLVITDHHMPGFTSLEAIDLIQNKDVDIPIIVVSDKISEEQAADIMRAGADDVVLKKNIFTRLVPAIERELSEAQTRKDKKIATVKVNALTRAIEQIRNIIFLTDANGKIEYANPQFTSVSQYELAEVLGKKPTFLDIEGNKEDTWYERLTDVALYQDEWTGPINSKKKNGDEFWSLVSISPVIDKNGKLINLVNIAAGFSEVKKEILDLQEKAFKDPLTGLYNQSMFDMHFKQTFNSVKRPENSSTKRHEKLAAFMYLDLDDFKVINDSLGHGEGNNLLKLVAQRISDSLRDSDLVSRIHGDEFNILLAELDQKQDAAKVAQKILYNLAKPIQLNNKSISVGISIGIAIMPTDGANIEEIRVNGDHALRRSKRNGKATFTYYNEKLH